MVFLVGIGWYFLGILPTDTEVKQKLAGAPFSLQKGGGGFGPLLEHSAPLLREKEFPAD